MKSFNRKKSIHYFLKAKVKHLCNAKVSNKTLFKTSSCFKNINFFEIVMYSSQNARTVVYSIVDAFL